MWRPFASTQTLRMRSEILRSIRSFFHAREVMEVEVPVLGEFGITDPNIDALTLVNQNKKLFLQTSPEYFMKRLLAAGTGDIYYLGKAFRKDEAGRIHHPEFTMLEWYRIGFDDSQLISELSELLSLLSPNLKVELITYQALFEMHLGFDPHRASLDQLKSTAKARIDIGWDDDLRTTWLDLLFTHCIEPELSNHEALIVCDYPVCQSALAKVAKNANGDDVAKRFECYLNGVELANGYFELCDAIELKERFNKDNELRLALNKEPIAHDISLIEATAAGMPECAGVALGIDRLVMSLLQLNSISEQKSF